MKKAETFLIRVQSAETWRNVSFCWKRLRNIGPSQNITMPSGLKSARMFTKSEESLINLTSAET